MESVSSGQQTPESASSPHPPPPSPSIFLVVRVPPLQVSPVREPQRLECSSLPVCLPVVDGQSSKVRVNVVSSRSSLLVKTVGQKSTFHLFVYRFLLLQSILVRCEVRYVIQSGIGSKILKKSVKSPVESAVIQLKSVHLVAVCCVKVE